MIELLILLGAIVIGGAGLVVWLNLNEEWAERDRMARFQEAMRRANPQSPPDRRED